MRRTPWNYDGTGKTGKSLADLLPEILRGIQEKAGAGQEEIFRCWQELIGGTMAGLTEPVSFVDGVLTVKVKSSTLYSLLCQHERPRLLKKLQEKFQVAKLVFKIG